jgi:hypothetical protein
MYTPSLAEARSLVGSARAVPMFREVLAEHGKHLLQNFLRVVERGAGEGVGVDEVPAGATGRG